MFRELRNKIEEKRNSKNFLWRSLVFGKDFIWGSKERLKLLKNYNLLKKVRARKLARAKQGVSYKDYPKLSLIVLSFNHRKNVKPIIERLRLTQAEEIIVCEDGSIDGSHQEWMRYLTHPNDFLIHSNDIHEIRAYNRAINHARGEIVCVIQDDDVPSKDEEWVTQVLKLFEKYPKLAILGGYRGKRFTSGIKYGYSTDTDKAEEIPFLDPHLKIPFMFIDGVTIGPIFFKKDLWMQLGGFDLSYSKSGEPGIGYDYEISLRAWSNGWQVGLYGPPPFKKFVYGRGSMMFSDTLREENKERNLELIRKTYGNKFDFIEKLIDDNNQTLKRRGMGITAEREN